MRFQVPQFIEIEDKIFGPLTIKQFIYVAGGAGLSFIIFRFSPSLLISIPLMVLVLGFSLAMAFYQINNKPLIYILQSAFGYFTSNKLYLWKKQEKTPEKIVISKEKIAGQSPMYNVPKSQNKLNDISMNLNTRENPEENSF
jgi:hypothetical protein